ncbi:hypothetical protein H4R18_004420 [Coemansia javaensis]|uniref:Uncharacterized protein n=1 Tax=Coemansia javaensis TaxID=2761396 RepID=A0A9W8H670_9FUNG|nr:hypothetical protein H4R18_004420 [Coemansia javaensis]
MDGGQARAGPCVAVHVGAGYHSAGKEAAYRRAMRRACRAAMGRLQRGGSANDAVEDAVRELEDAPVTNAGVGSNLNRAGLVECDASVMCTDPDAFGAVGAAAEICSPIQAANAVLKDAAAGPSAAAGLVPPMLLVGAGADAWARARGLPTSADQTHKVTDAARARHSEYMARALPHGGGDGGGDDALQDTVGAVCIDARGVVAAGVSSGGIALKHPGRVGEARCSVSGTGEQIMRTMLARDCAQRRGDMFAVLDGCFADFCTTPALDAYTQRSAGLILLRRDVANGNSTELGIAHTTRSMGYAYMSEQMSGPVARISRKPDSDKVLVAAVKL